MEGSFLILLSSISALVLNGCESSFERAPEKAPQHQWVSNDTNPSDASKNQLFHVISKGAFQAEGRSNPVFSDSSDAYDSIEAAVFLANRFIDEARLFLKSTGLDLPKRNRVDDMVDKWLLAAFERWPRQARVKWMDEMHAFVTSRDLETFIKIFVVNTLMLIMEEGIMTGYHIPKMQDVALTMLNTNWTNEQLMTVTKLWSFMTRTKRSHLFHHEDLFETFVAAVDSYIIKRDESSTDAVTRMLHDFPGNLILDDFQENDHEYRITVFKNTNSLSDLRDLWKHECLRLEK